MSIIMCMAMTSAWLIQVKKKGWGGNGGRSQESQESSCFYTAYILEFKGRDE